MTQVFLDAHVLFAAAASPAGGSALLLEFCRKKQLEPVVSRLVLLEAERNIRSKLPRAALKRFHRFLESIPFHVVPPPPEEEVRTYRAWIHEKDAPILAAAVASRSAYLVTLDRRHFMTQALRQAKLPLKVFTPGEFLKLVLIKSSLSP